LAGNASRLLIVHGNIRCSIGQAPAYHALGNSLQHVLMERLIVPCAISSLEALPG
jgi:hypothetical protein